MCLALFKPCAKQLGHLVSAFAEAAGNGDCLLVVGHDHLQHINLGVVADVHRLDLEGFNRLPAVGAHAKVPADAQPLWIHLHPCVSRPETHHTLSDSEDAETECSQAASGIEGSKVTPVQKAGTQNSSPKRADQGLGLSTSGC